MSVSSGADIFPLPVSMPIPGNITDSTLPNGAANGASSSAFLVTDSSLGSDEALGGALLTPIPWLTDTAIPGGSRDHVPDEPGPSPDPSPGSGLVSESLGPVPTREAGGVTQGELIRQEQEAGVVPSTHQQHAHHPQPDTGTPIVTREGRGETEAQTSPPAEDGEELPHARGPTVVGVEDMGLQDGKGVEMSLSPAEAVAVSEDQNLRQAATAASVKEAGGEEVAKGGAGNEDMLLTDADAEAEAEVVADGEAKAKESTVAAEEPLASSSGEGRKDAPEDEKMGL